MKRGGSRGVRKLKEGWTVRGDRASAKPVEAFLLLAKEAVGSLSENSKKSS
jgi:hypothetical protein